MYHDELYRPPPLSQGRQGGHYDHGPQQYHEGPPSGNPFDDPFFNNFLKGVYCSGKWGRKSPYFNSGQEQQKVPQQQQQKVQVPQHQTSPPKSITSPSSVQQTQAPNQQPQRQQQPPQQQLQQQRPVKKSEATLQKQTSSRQQPSPGKSSSKGQRQSERIREFTLMISKLLFQLSKMQE